MHTGYDNYWMYQNRRPEPLLSLPLSDIFSDAILTDSYKQGQNGRLPNLMSNYNPPQNNVVNSCQNDHRTMTGSQSSWPCSTDSYPHRPLYTNNFHFQEFSTQQNHVRHSSQRNHVSKSVDANFAQMYYKSDNHNFIHTQCNKAINSQAPRIRVKDLSSLNNNTIQSSVSENSLYHQKTGHVYSVNQTVDCNRTWNSNIQAEYVDYGKVNLPASNQHLQTYEPRAAKQISSSNQQHYIQKLEELCYRNYQFNSESQFSFSNNIEIQKNSSVDIARNNTVSAIKESLSTKNLQKAGPQIPVQNPTCDLLQKSKRVKNNLVNNFSELNTLNQCEPLINTEMGNNALHPCSLEQNKRLSQNNSNVNVVTNIQNSQESFLNFNQTDELLNQNSACSELRKWRKSEPSTNCNKLSFNQMNSQENSMIKITIPHTGQSTFISFDDSNSKGKNSLSFPCLLDFNDNLNRNEFGGSNKKSPNHSLNNTRENDKIILSTQLSNKTNLMNHNGFRHANPVCNVSSNTIQSNRDANATEQADDRSFRTSIISPSRSSLPSDQSVYQREPVVVCENVENPKTLADNSHENSNPVISNNTEANANVLTIKQELPHTEEETPSVQHTQNIVQDKICDQNIKTEKNPEESTEIHEPKEELQLTECPEPSQESLTIDADNTENIDFNQPNLEERGFSVKKHGSKSKTMSTALKDAKNRIQKPDLSIEISIEKKSSPTDNANEPSKKDCESDQNYKSQINRDKLDLLIQFLKKDEEINSSEAKNCGPIKTSNMRAKESDSNHSRRKLNKTCIVKNKNNTREMISLVSHKTNRVEINKSTSKTLSNELEDTNFYETNEIKTKPTLIENISEGDKNVEGLENGHLRSNESFDELDQARDDCLTSNPQNMFENEQVEDICGNGQTEKCDSQKEKSLISTIQALQKLKTHFCTICDLVSSVDSFWINVVSGELRCLNCLKKMTLEIEESISAPKVNNLSFDLMANPGEVENTGNKNYSKGGNRSKDVLMSDFSRQKSNDLIDCANRKSTETRTTPIKDQIITYSNDEQACKVDKNNALRKKKYIDVPKIFKQKKLLENLVKNKSAKSVVRQAEVPEDSVILNSIELSDNLTIKSFIKSTEITDKMRKSEESISPVKSRKISNSSENCSAMKSPTSSHSEPFSDSSVIKEATKVFKNVTKEGSSSSKISSKKTDVSQSEKGKATNKSDESHKKIIHKERDVFESYLKKDTSQRIDVQNKTVKRSSSKDFNSRKVRVLEEFTKKEMKQATSSPVRKLDFIENSTCDKSHKAEETSKKSTKCGSFNKSNAQIFYKNDCVDQKQKEKYSEDKLSWKSATSHSVSELKIKTESVEHSRKRKSSSAHHGSHKVRIVEEHPIKEIKHTDKSKIMNFFKEDIHKIEHDSNSGDSVERFRKKRLSKELCDDFGEKSKRDFKQDLDLERTKTKNAGKTDKLSGKVKFSHHSKHKMNDSADAPRKTTQDECTSPKHSISKKDSKKVVESRAQLKKNDVSKEELDYCKVLQHFRQETKHGGHSSENKERKKTENKKLNEVVRKMPKITQPDWEKSNYEDITSFLGDDQFCKLDDTLKPSKEAGNVKMKSTNRKDNLPNTKSHLRTHKKKEENEEGDKRPRKSDSQTQTKQRYLETVKNNSDKKQKVSEEWFDKNKQNRCSDGQRNKNRENDCIFGYSKIGAVSNEYSRKPVENEKVQSAELLAKLIKKTKKLSWSLLGEAKQI